MSPRIATHSRETPTITNARMTLVFLILSSAGVKLDVHDCNWLLKGMPIILEDLLVLEPCKPVTYRQGCKFSIQFSNLFSNR